MAGTSRRTRGRSVSAPSLRVSCSSYSRERSRLTDLTYERGKDNLAHWISAWNFDEVCGILVLPFSPDYRSAGGRMIVIRIPAWYQYQQHIS